MAGPPIRSDARTDCVYMIAKHRAAELLEDPIIRPWVVSRTLSAFTGPDNQLALTGSWSFASTKPLPQQVARMYSCRAHAVAAAMLRP